MSAYRRIGVSACRRLQSVINFVGTSQVVGKRMGGSACRRIGVFERNDITIICETVH